MELNLKKPLFVNKRDIVLRINPKEATSKNAVNHLIMGDYAHYINDKNGDWVKIRSRGSNGWVKQEWLTNKRMLEVNFVDIGQGDGCHIVTPKGEIILIDAGEGEGFDGSGADNMTRFISWRYNLRNRLVVGVDGATAVTENVKAPLSIDYAIISHPDLDHYYGFYNIFKSRKVKIQKLCHNGIVERSLNGAAKSDWLFDLGRKVPTIPRQKKYHLWDTVLTNQEMHDLVDANLESRKYYLKTLVQAKLNNKEIKFDFLSKAKEYLDHFKGQNELKVEVLAPITETVEFNGEERECLIKLGNEGETKNGHSVVFQLHYGKLKMMLGGDLNTKSQDYLAQKYSGLETKLSDLEKDIKKIKEKLKGEVNLSTSKRQKLEQDLEEHQSLIDLIITRTRRKFGTDIAKACHHGASDVLDSFLRAINPIATIISSGDNESHSHPRPDALGAFGKASRGERPLIFSTELARSSSEFSYPIKFFSILKKMETHMNAATSKKEKERRKVRMEKVKDSNVVKYGMITVRTDGERVIIAQKLEKKRSAGQKWDIYDLIWNKKIERFEYGKVKNH